MKALAIASLWFALLISSIHAEEPYSLRGEIQDAQSGEPLPARLYIRSGQGNWFFARSASPQGSAVEYRKQRSPESVEMHTTLSAHSFVADLPPGRYTITVERGKEYFPETQTVTVGDRPVTVRIRLRRWIDMAHRGWYSGDTHVHRSLAELPNLLLAEDVNVGLPLTYWVTVTDTAPTAGKRTPDQSVPAELIRVDDTHVIYPLNTEYEIFSVGRRRHTLGAVFVLNHRKPLSLPVPPVQPVAERARKEGALLDLDKHSWPWSMMLVPVMDVDLFELANNHVWRTEFLFRDWTIDTVPEFMQIERDDRGMTEWGWIDFGFKTYYALLNCGFRMRPTAGTASGVHPVPLGFGRVYVHLPDGFDYDAWMEGLDQGRSFVTTGPMLLARFNDELPGHVFHLNPGDSGRCHVTGSVESSAPLDRIELVVNGRVSERLAPANEPSPAGGFVSPIDAEVAIDESAWLAVRCFQPDSGGRVRFAHTAPVHFELPGKPLRPRRAEAQYFIDRMEEEIERNTGVLSEAALEEYREALGRFQSIAERAR